MPSGARTLSDSSSSTLTAAPAARGHHASEVLLDRVQTAVAEEVLGVSPVHPGFRGSGSIGTNAIIGALLSGRDRRRRRVAGRKSSLSDRGRSRRATTRSPRWLRRRASETSTASSKTGFMSHRYPQWRGGPPRKGDRRRASPCSDLGRRRLPRHAARRCGHRRPESARTPRPPR